MVARWFRKWFQIDIKPQSPAGVTGWFILTKNVPVSDKNIPLSEKCPRNIPEASNWGLKDPKAASFSNSVKSEFVAVATFFGIFYCGSYNYKISKSLRENEPVLKNGSRNSFVC